MAFSEYAEFFDHFAPVLSAATRHDLNGDILRCLTLARQDSLRVAYAPFDHVPRHARLVIVGITPGRVQAVNAIATAAAALRAGKNPAEASRIAKLTGSLSGPTRRNLIAMLDHIGLSSILHIASCPELFESSAEAIYFTSALRYPAFVEEANYNGTPDIAEGSTASLFDRHLPSLRGASVKSRGLASSWTAAHACLEIPVRSRPARPSQRAARPWQGPSRAYASRSTVTKTSPTTAPLAT